MATRENFVVVFRAQGAQALSRAVLSIQNAFKGANARLAAFAKTTAKITAVGATTGVAAIGVKMRSAAKEVDFFAKSAVRLDTSIDKIQQLELVAEKAGTSFDRLGPAIQDVAAKVARAASEMASGSTSEATEALQRLGFTAEQIQNMGRKPGPIDAFAASQAGYSMEAIRKAQQKQASLGGLLPLGGGEPAQIIRNFGGQRDAMEIFTKIFERIRSRTKGADRMQVAQDLFGDDAAFDLFTLFDAGSLNKQLADARKRIRKGKSELTDKDAEIAQKTADQFSEAINSINNTFRKIAAQPEMLEFATAIREGVDEAIDALGGAKGIATGLRDFAKDLSEAVGFVKTELGKLFDFEGVTRGRAGVDRVYGRVAP